MYYDCCDHQFVCKDCYNQNPGYDKWRPKFGIDHSVYDTVSGESGLSRLLGAMMKDEAQGMRMGNITLFKTTKF